MTSMQEKTVQDTPAAKACARDTAAGPAAGAAARPAGARRGKNRQAPWKKPGWCLWFAVSVLISAWLAVNMPAPQATARRAPAAAAMQAPGAHEPGTQASGTQPSRHRAPAAPGIEAAASAAVSAGETKGSSMARMKRMRESQPDGAVPRLLYRLKVFARLFLFVGLGAMLGAVIEGRCWYRVLAGSLGRVTRAARMPEIVAASIPTALASAPAADSMLVASHARGELSTSTLVAAGMINSFLAHFSHAMRIFYPVVAAIGLPGLAYFVIQFGGMALVIFFVLVWHRVRAGRREQAPSGCASQTACAAAAAHDPLPWPETLKKGVLRAASLLFRLACVSVPMILAMEWAINAGALNFWERLVPETVSTLFPEQLLTIMAAQIGGLIQSSTLCAGLMAQGLITGPQILLAMLLASVVTNPARTIRRNLPTALAIFPPRAGCIIVLGMQFARLSVTLLAAALLLAWMHAELAA